MAHPSSGALRRVIDEPLAVATRDRDHFSHCPECQSRITDVERNAQAVSRLLGMPGNVPDIAAALQRQRAIQTGAAAKAGAISTFIQRRTRPLAPARRRVSTWSTIAVAAAIVAGALLLPAGTWAHDLLSVFEPRSFETVPVTTQDLRTLPNLTQYGVMSVPASPTSRLAANWAAAASAAGFVPLVPRNVPAALARMPRYMVIAPVSASFTFSAARVRMAALKAGRPLPPMPANLDGSVLRMAVGPVVVTTYGHGAIGELLVPDLIIVQARVPVVTASGASVQEIERYLLAQPGVSDQLRSQIRAIGDPAATLPVPVPIDLVRADVVSVQGQRALAMGDSTNLGSGVLWRRGGMVFAVAGSRSEDSVIAIANSLH